MSTRPSSHSYKMVKMVDGRPSISHQPATVTATAALTSLDCINGCVTGHKVRPSHNSNSGVGYFSNERGFCKPATSARAGLRKANAEH